MNEQLKNALEEVLKIDPKAGNNAYAIAYTQAIFDCDFMQVGLKTQLRYILANLQYWRGKKAREVKKVLNDFINGRIK